MTPVAGMVWLGDYGFRPFRVATTDHDFVFSHQNAQARSGVCKGSNISAVWTLYGQEVLINGVLQGRKQDDPKGASMVSRKKIAELVHEVNSMLEVPHLQPGQNCASYAEFKASKLLEHRRQVKVEVKSKALRGWIPNVADDFEIDTG